MKNYHSRTCLGVKAGLYVSLGLVVNILAIFSSAYILKKNKRIKRYHIKRIGCLLLMSINIIIFDQETEQ